MYKRRIAVTVVTVLFAMSAGAERAVAQSDANLAALNEQIVKLISAGRYEAALPLARKSLELAQRIHEPSVATSMSNLANVYENLGRDADAESLLKSALALEEATLGPLHVDVSITLTSLATIYLYRRRYAEAEPLFKRSLAIKENAIERKALSPNDPSLAKAINNLALCYKAQGRVADAEPLYKRAIAIHQAAKDDLLAAGALNNLAALYYEQDRYAEAEPLYVKALAIHERKRHPDLAVDLNNLGNLYLAEGKDAKAEPLYKRAIAVQQRALGPDHAALAATISHLAAFYFGQKEWAKAADQWQKSTDIIVRRVKRGTDFTARGTSETERDRKHFLGLIKAAYRLAEKQSGGANELAAQMFGMAQWSQGSQAAVALAKMAVRQASGNAELVGLVRERQQLVDEWQQYDKLLLAAASQSPEQRDAATEKQHRDRVSAIDLRIASIDRTFADRFPDYSALASAQVLSIGDVQALLTDGEALVLLLDTPQWGPTPDESFIWVVTKTQARWIRSDMGNATLSRGVWGMRCGLDGALWDNDADAAGCRGILRREPQRDVFGNIRAETMPFDLAGAHALYKGLFGQVEDLIRDKHLLLVAQGPLTQLPFQVLVDALPSGEEAGARSRVVTRLGTEFAAIPNDMRAQLQLRAGSGVRIVRSLPGTPAEAAGVRAGDILLAVDGVEVGGVQQAIAEIRKHASGSRVSLSLLRDGRIVELTVTAETTTIQEWIYRFLDPASDRDIRWLAKSHPITVLPAVSSLKALRRVAKASSATQPMLGIGNPLLDGSPADAKWAALARARRTCKDVEQRQVADAGRKVRGIARVATRGGHADPVELRALAPLPDTADELCAAGAGLQVTPDDILLGERATETTLKAMSSDGRLAQYRVLHFATHGVVAGEIESATESGLVLTPPAEASDTDDGYLSASEVAGLKLDAGLVILSACNTAAGGAKGAEALSGLARAFIYAGARALLVSHWSVDSAATVKLITSTVGSITRNNALGRSEALRRAMVDMIDKSDPRETHPAFWAPFVVVGEGGAR
jgi:CHAT domain-containing protein/tetratricopeptide (TPR) repeat protein